MNGDVYNEPRYAKEIVGAGALTGLLGGALIAVAMALLGGALGAPPADLARGISAVLRGGAAMVGGTGDVASGLAVHLVVAFAWGVLFAWFVGRATNAGTALTSALVYGTAIWALMTYVVVPSAAPRLAAVLEPVPWWATLGAHLLYALPLALAPWLQRRIGRVPGERGSRDHAWVGRPAQVPGQG